MLISALNEYYDILAASGKVLPEGYSKVKIHYLIALTEEGNIDGIINCQKKVIQRTSAGKEKEVMIPIEYLMPERTEKPGIEANIAEHRATYIFGLMLDKDQNLITGDEKGKAKKSHAAFVKASLEFTENLNAPIVCAFRKFVQNWNPDEETENPELIRIGKEYMKSNFAFCLTGAPDILLQEDGEFKERWEEWRKQKEESRQEMKISQCAICGKEIPIARIHGKIKGINGGLATGCVLVGFNNPSENSYGNEQSYNSNISEIAMRKYTEAFNYLLSSSSGKHKATLDDMTIVFWAMDKTENCENLVSAMLFGSADKMDAGQVELALQDIWKEAKKGKSEQKKLEFSDMIQPDVDFYMVGLKPNSSRVSIKFLYRKKCGEILYNIAQFQKDIQMKPDSKPVSLYRIQRELISPKSKSEKVSPALTARIMEAVLYGNRYPASLLETVVRRIKVDEGSEKINSIRVGIIKAVINRNSKKEELKMGLDRENENQGYLCGRMFAALEKIQQDASGGKLNRTIKDTYFAAASTRPAMTFPKLLRLAQNHLNKLSMPSRVYYNKLMGEISDKLQGGYPERLCLSDQGKYMVGYYQQVQSFYEKNKD